MYAESSAKIVFEHFRGFDISFPTPVKFEQSRENVLRFTGKWERGVCKNRHQIMFGESVYGKKTTDGNLR